jgi:chorismate synthase
MLRWLTAGESHGPALVAVLEGLPADVPVTTDLLAGALARRRLGKGRGARMSFEQDALEILGGVRHGCTIGAPVAVRIANTEWPKWAQVMSADPVAADVLAGLARNAPLTRPRPGHADLVGMQKYDFDEARPVLERASARETAARVALGAVAGSFLDAVCGARVLSHVVSIGTAAAPAGRGPARTWSPRSRPPTPTATHWVAWSRWSCTGCHLASAATSTATGGSTRGWQVR